MVVAREAGEVERLEGWGSVSEDRRRWDRPEAAEPSNFP